jgi:demethylmenaquinone methyltransferase/2-methoxy-6-polyprenyl-1,4-benzoquinol methylase
MFSAIAPRYDLANQVLSFGLHRRWRRKAVELSGASRGQSVLDCATGTGDFALAFKRAVGAFGIRNVDDPVVCLREMVRVLRPGGRVVVLEFGQPRGAFGAMFRLYSHTFLPPLGSLLSGHREAYEYLHRTAAAFPAGERFLALMDDAGGFERRSAHPLTFGTAFVYLGFVR